jgi:predicted secreted hydrolase
MAWMDHEFSSNQLSPDETGWDWISVQLNNGQDLMLYRLRQSALATHAGAQGLGSESVSPFSSGTLVQADGHSQPLQSTDFTADPQNWWKSPHTGARYPVGWRIKVPRAGIELSLSPALDDQELQTAGSTGVTYWEGAVDASGQSAGKPVSGQGYVELTGYSGGLDGLR